MPKPKGLASGFLSVVWYLVQVRDGYVFFHNTSVLGPFHKIFMNLQLNSYENVLVGDFYSIDLFSK